MRKQIVAVLVLAVAWSALSAEAGARNRNEVRKSKRFERVATAQYDAPAVGSPSSPVALCHTGISCPTFDTAIEERFVTVEIGDASGTPTPFLLSAATPDSMSVDEYGVFCGSTGPKPVRIKEPGTELVVEPFFFGDTVCPGGFGTTGTVTAVFTNVP